MQNAINYVRRNARKVQGWLHPLTAEVILGIAKVQRSLEGRTRVCEIGVHHGKLFILLHNLADPDNPSVAIDIFDQQELNADQSGKGDLDRFQSNMRRFASNPESLRVIAKLSTLVTAEEILQGESPISLFSVDGGHTVECVINDLRLAQDTLSEYGVVILDDVFNAYWPEVVVGTLQYTQSSECDLQWYAISPNKVYLCRKAVAEQHRRMARAAINPGLYEKTVDVLGSPVDVYGVRQALPGFVRTLKSKLLLTTFGRRLRDWKRNR